MKDPYYSRILFRIEGHVHDYDQRVQDQEEVQLKDSDVKSALRRAMSQLKKPSPWTKPKNQNERLKGALAIELLGIYEHLAKTDRVSRQDFIKVLLATEDTLKLRREMAGHSRGYLEFLEDFIPQARGE